MGQAVGECRYDVVSPLGNRRSRTTSEPAAGQLRPGATVAFLWDYVFKGDEMSALIEDALRSIEPGLRFVRYEAFGNIHDNDVIRTIAEPLGKHDVDIAIALVGACGSCTPAVIRTCAAAESAGVRTVAIVGHNFEGVARALRTSLGIEHVPLVSYPGPSLILTDSPEEFERKVLADVVPQITSALTAPPTARDQDAMPDDDPGRVSGVVMSGTLEEIQDVFTLRRWTDGLPIIPPTAARVEEFLRFTDRARDEVLGELLPDRREATVWNVAVNAAMAGCQPDYFPLVLAIAECLSADAYGLDEFGCTPGIEPLVVVSGPVVRQLDFNCGAAAMRVGRRANTTIGRFVRLFMTNIAGLRIDSPRSSADDPVANDNSDSGAIAQSFHVAMAEDAAALEAIGWPSHAVDRGFRPGESAVTLTGVVHTSSPIYSRGDHAEDHLATIADYASWAMASWGLIGSIYFRKAVPWSPLLLISPALAHRFASDGLGKDDIREALAERCRIPARTVERHARDIGMNEFTLAQGVEIGAFPPRYAESSDPDRLVPQIRDASDVQIVVGGNPGRNQSKFYVAHSAFGYPQSRRV